MPTRLIREGIISSDRVEQLEPAAEVFYRRLLNKVDDYGLYDARASILRANLYPLRIDRVREADISRWMAACQKAGLIALYENGGKPYLMALFTRWQTRSEAKYPKPPPELISAIENGCKQLQTDVTVVVDVVVDECTTLSGNPDANPPIKAFNGVEARQILAFLNEKAGRRYQANRVNMGFIVARLKDGATVTECRQVIAKKCREWGGDEKMAEYLRPATLFGATKFAQYQGELVVPHDASEP